MTAWTVVPNLQELLEQMNARFPNRDKASDGAIGDLAHQGGKSSHNPDGDGNAEYKDGDSKNEVRARDFDKDLKDAGGVTMEDVVQMLVKLARAGRLPHLRYVIFNKRIWHKRDNFNTRAYTGSNPHDKHMHVNSDFSQAADSATGVDWGLKNLGRTAPKPTAPKPSAPVKLKEDGDLGPLTIKRWQQVMKTTADGKIDPKDSQLVRAVQRRLKATVDHRLVVDGAGIYQDGKRYRTVGALQRYLRVPVDEKIDVGDSRTIRALQRRLNENRF